MKKKLNFLALAINFILSIAFAVVISPALGAPLPETAAVIFSLSTIPQLIFPDALSTGILMAGVYREIWTGQLVESFQPEIDASFLAEIPSFDQYVQSSAGGENQVIHLVDIGADPEVLINNNTYPIGYSTSADGDIAFQLDKFQTVATKVTDDELYAITYDKIATVNRKHRNAILAKKFGKAVHALAPAANTTSTPIVPTSGPLQAGKKLASVNDIIDLAGMLNDAGVPDDGQRVLVLNTKHNTGILKEVKDFYKDYLNISTGQLRPLFHGFRVYLYHNMPFYLAADNTKVAYGALFDNAIHSEASVAFYAPDMFRASGDTRMYFDEPDTQNQAAAVNYRHYYLVAPKKARAIGAIVTV